MIKSIFQVHKGTRVRDGHLEDVKYWLTSKLDTGNSKFLSSSLAFGMYILLTIPTVGTIFKDTALRDQSVVMTIGIVHMT